jgi:hypothetical protein
MVLTGKPNNSAPPGRQILPEEPRYIPKVHLASDVPRTTSEIYGWDTVQLVRQTDRRFYHPKQVTEITKSYGTAVKTKSAAEVKPKK